jgi:hydrogenase maturation protease
MLASGNRILLLALGNDLMGDDAAGLAVAKLLRQELTGEIDVVESSAAGFELMELLEGYDRALIVDAINTRTNPPGRVLEFTAEEFTGHAAWSAHYAGLPEILELASRLEIPFPSEIRILAMEIDPLFETRIGLSDQITLALPKFLARARSILHDWLAEKAFAPRESSTIPSNRMVPH